MAGYIFLLFHKGAWKKNVPGYKWLKSKLVETRRVNEKCTNYHQSAQICLKKNMHALSKDNSCPAGVDALLVLHNLFQWVLINLIWLTFAVISEARVVQAEWYSAEDQLSLQANENIRVFRVVFSPADGAWMQTKTVWSIKKAKWPALKCELM